ncbi:hypothetical protein PVL29_001023 [Vitis rotundifolia]|uniref:Uncharacterized protein n=1 Tax=Vitis rotundifolia TaxID=103349 RepID=A0AA39AKN1_VITRO|nr:hypothetical protein PVL29_001023 [Vitis rotundifolia]
MTLYPHRGGCCSGASLIWGASSAGLIPFILNYNQSEVAFVNDGAYIGFMCFMSADTVLTLVILHPNRVVRDNNNHCTNIKYSDVSTEAVEILKLFRNWKMLLMVPAAWASTRPCPAPKTHLVRGWDLQLICKWEWETFTRPAPGLGRGWERHLCNWDGNGERMAPPKPAPLPILKYNSKETSF